MDQKGFVEAMGTDDDPEQAKFLLCPESLTEDDRWPSLRAKKGHAIPTCSRQYFSSHIWRCKMHMQRCIRSTESHIGLVDNQRKKPWLTSHYQCDSLVVLA
jgi:hypothetical protein